MAVKDTRTIYVSFTQPYGSNREADFSFIAHQLKTVHVDANFECFQLRPGENLWERISPWITSSGIAGWAYILTAGNLKNQGCMKELLAAQELAIRERGARFPVVGLLYHGVAAQTLPLTLRLRPCIHVADQNWKEQLQGAITRNTPVENSEFSWIVHRTYGGDSNKTAIEVCPRSDVVKCWRFAVPRSAHAVRWGCGSPHGGEISPVLFSALRGTGRLENTEINWFGCEDALSQTVSAYVVFEGQLPDFVCFGRARTPASAPGRMEIFRLPRQTEIIPEQAPSRNSPACVPCSG